MSESISGGENDMNIKNRNPAPDKSRIPVFYASDTQSDMVGIYIVSHRYDSSSSDVSLYLNLYTYLSS